MSKLKPINAYEHAQLFHAQDELRLALARVKLAGSPKTADKIRSALKSIGGALRHAERRASVAQ